jgi:hypothetical protein
MENGASMYSMYWREEKYVPSTIVAISPFLDFFMSCDTRAWCLKVTLAPEDRRMIVFRRGVWEGLNTWMPVGGHTRPISKVGDRLLWKNLQKNDRKKKISDTINKIIPHFRLRSTLSEWIPWNVPSRLTSRHH